MSETLVNRDVLVIGGGLAGLAASLRLIDAGWRPIVLESRRRLGGRACSFTDGGSGHTLDNCQHVLMGCCTELLDFYTRIGVVDDINWYESTTWLRPDGGRDMMSPGWLPAPLHMAGSLRRMRLLSRRDKREVKRAMWKMWRLGQRGRLSMATRTFASLLDEWNQGDRVRELFWEPIIVGACNLAIDEVAAIHGLQVFQDGFLAGRWQATMGVPSVPLDSLYEPAIKLIEQGGGEVRLGCAATRLAIEGRRAIGVETKEKFVRARAVLSALPWERLDAIIGDTERDLDSRLHDLASLGHSPILGVHLMFDKAVMSDPHLVLPDRAVHWLFNKSIGSDGTQHIHAVISAADDWMELKEPEIRRRVLQDVAAAYPAALEAELVQCRPVKERNATFRATPEAELHRPHAAPTPIGPHGGDIEGLYLAGDWCATGWPATMEGAVRSGYAAAAAIVAAASSQ
ncbi:MAG: hydroxysqualene dehydroxylase HpnE [Phycisphaerales bacterium]|nr:hydroxysqualene dehydroxylase HpnE [Phycisphaerales bacterium]MDP7087847.1 hydroxysqualene dehydroxylase HpnE [Phycisphaerales bacterium]MDP7188301.1 hydroxysqualene dehydroxylase HpnE [Phycisphaerales bacterium]MDP7520020.1 hydroxysqualene dehydroxylase HpnE [Phycisphaerales bacterium]HJN80800.1 hydroxysqualene dehydroxylase HpnE [Phycisphaerales bacterium]